MKVNVIGRGAISGIGLLPVHDIELDKAGISRILNFNNVRVADAATKRQITRQNLDEFFAEPEEEAAVEETVVDTPVVEEPVKETYVEPVVETVVEEAPVVEEVIEEPVVTVEETETAPVEEEAVEEVIDATDEVPAEETPEEKPAYSNSNKKNKKRR